MKSKFSSLTAVLSGLFAFKSCCILPSLLSLFGLASSGGALVAVRWLSAGLALVSLGTMAHSFYGMYVLKCGSRASRCLTWASALVLVLTWSIRLAGPAFAQALLPAERPSAASAGRPAPAEPAPDCPCRRATQASQQ